MPPTRRYRGLIAIVVLALIVVVYWTTAASSTRASDVYVRTKEALALKNEPRPADILAGDNHATSRNEKLDTNERKHMPDSPVAAVQVQKPAPVAADSPVHDTAAQDAEQAEKGESELELNYILKRSPIIIFSKTFCPFSKKAKTILLHNYDIQPPPFVVELNTHKLGRQLQQRLFETTGRKTVPNVLVGGVSLGGGDDIEELHLTHKLVSRIETLVGKRVKIVAL